MAANQLFTNNAVTLLAADISESDLIITVQSGYGNLFPNPSDDEFFLVTLENTIAPTNREIIKIIGRSGDIFTVAPNGRGWESTTPQAWQANQTLVDHRITAGTLYTLCGNFGKNSNGILIPVSETKQINTLNITQLNKTCKWILTIQTSDNRISMSEIIAVYKPLPSQPIFTEYAKTGDIINYSINVVGASTSMILEITNNDSVDFTSVDVMRLQHYT